MRSLDPGAQIYPPILSYLPICQPYLVSYLPTWQPSVPSLHLKLFVWPGRSTSALVDLGYEDFLVLEEIHESETMSCHIG